MKYRSKHSSEAQKSTRPTALKSTLSAILTFGTAIIFALLILNFVFQSYQVSGESMEPTLQNKDRLIVWKLPRSWAKVTGHAYIPKRGDIVIVDQKDLSACSQSGRQIVKRVIGLPGDTVVAGNKTFTIYNKQHPGGFQPDKTLPYGKNILKPVIQSKKFTVKAGQVFISGDNRLNSCDSRFFGPINSPSIIGKLALRVIPIKHIERF